MAQSMLESDVAHRVRLHTQATACVPSCCSALRCGKTKNCAWFARRGAHLL